MFDISIIIKSWNEETHIADAISSALAALEELSGEVILADCCSADRTVEIAMNYPISIISLAHPSERTCGIAAQMGYQAVTGEFIYILDADMELKKDFLYSALEIMRNTPSLGGVAGLLEEMGGGSYEFALRLVKQEHSPGEVLWLNGGGLYRRAAIEKCGYLTNRNLHACEEMELGLRITNAGFKLLRLAIPAIRHYGHTEPTFLLLRKRWRSGTVFGTGELLRSAWGKPYFGTVVRQHITLIIAAIAELSLLAGIFLAFWRLSLLAATLFFWISLYIIQVVRRKGTRAAFQSICSVFVYAAGMMWGIMTSQTPPYKEIAAVMLKSGSTELLPQNNAS